MVKLVDTPDLGSGAARRGSSSLSTRTISHLLSQIIAKSLNDMVFLVLDTPYP